MAERTLSETRFGVGSVVAGLRLLLIGTMTGVMGGMGSFLFINAEFMPLGLGENWGLLIIAVAGVYTHLIAADLRESVSAAIIASFVGIGLHVGASIAPLWLLSYHPMARDVLLPGMLGRSWTGSIFGYFATFIGTWGAAVVVDAYYER